MLQLNYLQLSGSRFLQISVTGAWGGLWLVCMVDFHAERGVAQDGTQKQRMIVACFSAAPTKD